jgi:tetratricopeptide (TPR) repeat protein
MRKRVVCLLVMSVFCLNGYPQDSKSLQDLFLEAEFFFINENYEDAIINYLQIYDKAPDNANVAYCIGVCYLNIPGKKNLSVDYLEKAVKNISSKHKEGTITQVAAPYESLFELGMAYRINYMFDKAKDAFNKYLGTLLPDDRENIDFTRHEIEVCDMAVKLISKPVTFTEENLGEPFNNENPNFSPVISADGKSFAFMVSLKFYDAVMFTRLINGKWAPVVNITPELQSDGDLYISCFSSDGKQLYLSKDDNYNSDIYMSTYDGASWNKPAKLNKNINTKYWESHGFVTESGDKLIFASDRRGGFGGLDLYISNKVNGEWGPAVNLGPEINTRFNEDRPFLINKGKTLFFSSQGHENIGGYDIFRSGLQSNSLWNKPENIGYPLNNTDDNFFFMPIGEGKSGYYSIFKESGGYGKEDIYKITFR